MLDPGKRIGRTPPSLAQSVKTWPRGMPPVCRGWIPVSRRRGSWRLRDMPGISTCTNTPLWPRIRSKREAVEARHGQSAAMPCPFQTSSVNHSFSYISEGGGLRVNRRACISLFFCGCLGEGEQRGGDDRWMLFPFSSLDI